MDAIELLRGRSFDLLITDIRMPQMDGLKLAGAARELYPQLPIVILSGYDEFSYAQEAIRHGVSDYLLKPIETDRLQQVLEEMVRRLEDHRSRTHSSRHLRELAGEYQNSLAAEYLEALYEGSSSRKMAVAPFVKQLDLSLFGSEQRVVSVALDYQGLLPHTDTSADLATYDFVLYQTLRDLSKEWPSGRAYYFGSGGYRALISGGEAQAADFVRTLVRALKTGVGFEAAGGISRPVSSVEEFSSRVREADAALLGHLAGGPGVYLYEPQAERPSLFSVRREAYHAAIENDLPRLEHLLDVYEHAAEKLSLSLSAYALWLFYPRPEGLARLLGSEADCAEATDALLSALRAGGSFGQVKRLLLDAFKRMNRSEAPAPGDEPAKSGGGPVDKARRFILENYPKPISLIDIAEYAGVSPNYLSTLFSRQGGESYIKYLTRIRMEAAARLLRENPAQKVAEIAESCGFFNIKHFYHVFRQTYGLSPGEYQSSQAAGADGV